MVARETDASAAADREIVITRLLNAPRELVFDAWTDPKHVVKWWGGPRGFTTTTHEIDVKVGGTWRFNMRGPDGVDYPNVVVYREIVRPERIAYVHGDGGDDTFESVVTFDEEDGKTRLTMRAIFATAAERNRHADEYGAVEGGIQHLDRLEEYLAKMNASA